MPVLAPGTKETRRGGQTERLGDRAVKIIIIVLIFIYIERERERESRGGAEREKEERESQAGFMLSAQNPTRGSNSRAVRS